VDVFVRVLHVAVNTGLKIEWIAVALVVLLV